METSINPMVKVLSDIINPKSVERQQITMIRGNQIDYIGTRYFEITRRVVAKKEMTHE